eukprot:TRINITY_DN68_c0_g1_i1.p1 TRINITY_DN68_c0_g1~~TRINITY_DN68_c0_g1_i1.p1  ORF type:complete len:110 (+),score=49.16 TRINITY_DN68_c0_g1_i1:38-367(+)
MKHVAAYLLAVLGGNQNPTAADVKKILASVNVEAEDSKLEKLVSELQGKNLQELIDAGKKKLSAIPSGGAAPVAAAAPAASASAAAAPAAEKPKEKEESEEAVDFDLFG